MPAFANTKNVGMSLQRSNMPYVLTAMHQMHRFVTSVLLVIPGELLIKPIVFKEKTQQFWTRIAADASYVGRLKMLRFSGTAGAPVGLSIPGRICSICDTPIYRAAL